ncbi:hypothetical protein TNIN_487851 [Trichonephila inaurata madagascariensis]|uniref:Uncharacterized protein n=1 Tax=Trichonephila inaurata madagascariensis TaxID=2747483 RepID=A0A8X6MAV8_9ARAC|nr:hypothetical protein TNIN_487851 [Trichonephila inaurata madagascariensis]
MSRGQARQTLSSRAISSTRWTTTEETPEREALHLGRHTQGHCKELGLVTATGILETRNPAACSSVGSLSYRPMVYILNKVYICTHRVVSYIFI